jgi:serine/threonine protein kinase
MPKQKESIPRASSDSPMREGSSASVGKSDTSLKSGSLQPPGFNEAEACGDSVEFDWAGDELVESARYRLLKRVGQGGMGIVYLAEDLQLRRFVAIKLAVQRLEWLRFEREATITALLDHPGVVPILGQGQHNGHPYYVMRYVQGQPLDSVISDFHRKIQTANDYFRPEMQLRFRELLARFVAVCRTVPYAHSRGVIHRDIKPANVLVGQYCETIVLDWGLARRLISEPEKPVDMDSQLDGEMTRTGVCLGTPAYMAPEQREGNRADERTDVFLLGATMYHLLCGKAPFADSETLIPPASARAGCRPPWKRYACRPCNLARKIGIRRRKRWPQTWKSGWRTSRSRSIRSR